MKERGLRSRENPGREDSDRFHSKAHGKGGPKWDDSTSGSTCIVAGR
jgi:hypothetical protein